MLVNFRIENFLSFNGVTTFSMTLGKSKLHQENILKNDPIDLLKFAAIYGANASGKSNFISGISFAQKTILEGLDKQLPSSLYNRNHEENKNRKSRFEFEFVLNEHIFSYGFSVLMSESKIVEEWLYDITKEEIPVFTRSDVIEINYPYLNLDQKNRVRLEVYAEDSSNNNTSLFLTSLNSGKNKLITEDGNTLFSDLFSWFRDVLEVVEPNQAAREFGLTYHNKDFLEQLGTYLENSDTGVTNVVLEQTEDRLKGIPLGTEKQIREKIIMDLENDEDQENVEISALIRTSKSIYLFIKENGDVNTYELKFEHGKERIKYALSEESDGTVRLVELFSVLYNNKEKVFVIDELDRSLHPLLTLDFVQKFLNKTGLNQLIISTHEDRLLDLSLLRRDEIWFVEKEGDGNSILYSLEDYKERFDKNILNAYLDGRYGAVPQITQIILAE